MRNNRKKSIFFWFQKKAMAKTVAQTLKISVLKTSPFQPTHPSIATAFYCLGQSLSPSTLQFSCFFYSSVHIFLLTVWNNVFTRSFC